MENVIVLFEVTIKEDFMKTYLKLAQKLKEELVKNEGFLSSKRYTSLNTKGKILSKSVWKDEESIEKWRHQIAHRMCQKKEEFRVLLIIKLLLLHQDVHILYQIEKKHQKILMNFLNK